jgi:hypothetical protein
MKIEVNIDSSNLGPTIVDTFKNLSAKDSKDIVKQVVKEWLQEKFPAERIAEEQRVMDLLLKEDPSTFNRYSDSEIRQNYRFKDRMKNFKSARDTLVGDISSSAITHIKAEVDRQIKEDEQIQQVLNLVLQEIRDNFPKIVHDAMISWFCTHMGSVSTGINQALQQTNNMGSMLENINSKLRASY